MTLPSTTRTLFLQDEFLAVAHNIGTQQGHTGMGPVGKEMLSVPRLPVFFGPLPSSCTAPQCPHLSLLLSPLRFAQLTWPSTAPE